MPEESPVEIEKVWLEISTRLRYLNISVKYLSHIASEYGVETDTEKIKALTTWPISTNFKELRIFFGLCWVLPGIHPGLL